MKIKKEWDKLPHELKKVFWLEMYSERETLNKLNSDEYPKSKDLTKFIHTDREVEKIDSNLMALAVLKLKGLLN